MNKDYIENELQQLPLTEAQWDIFMEVLTALYRAQSLSKQYIALRWNTSQKVIDRVLMSLIRLNWGFFSLGNICITQEAISALDQLKLDCN